MAQVDAIISDFSIVVYLLVSSPNGNLLLVALAATLVAGTWLGMRIYLHRYGARTEGTVTEAFVKSTTVDSTDFSASSRMHSHYLKIQYAGPDRVKRIIKGSRYASELDDNERASLQVGGKVPVYYLKSWPSIAVYYVPVWHYIAPAASLVAALLFLFMAADAFEDTFQFASTAIEAGPSITSPGQ
jgi:hypothetical protein